MLLFTLRFVKFVFTCETYLHSIVAEEKPRIGAHSHLEAGGTAPKGRLPDQQGEGAALVAAVTRAEDV